MTRHLIETAVVAAAAVVVSYAASFLLTRRAGDDYARHYVRRAVHFISFLIALVVVGFVWNVFSSRAGLGFGFFAAGLAFALREVIGEQATFDEPVFNYSTMWEFVWQDDDRLGALPVVAIVDREHLRRVHRVLRLVGRGDGARPPRALPGAAQRAGAARLCARDGQLHGARGCAVSARSPRCATSGRGRRSARLISGDGRTSREPSRSE